MTTFSAALATPDLGGLGERVTAALDEFLDDRAGWLGDIGPDLAPVAATVRDFVLDGGKRLRPAFAYWGWRGVGGPDGEEIVRAVACLELLHAGALVHDDLMDASETRRGAPSVHRRFASLHRRAGWRGSPDAFGAAGAILLGDLCLVWADTMLAGSGLPAEGLMRAIPVYHEMRAELMAGQYLDVLAQATGGAGPAGALRVAQRVARYKSAKYTVERPLHLGAALAGGSEPALAAYTAYGLPLGEAFQLRDDLLGVFGDPAETGKPAGDDLREGKRTALVALTLERTDRAGAVTMRRLLGDPDLDAGGVAELREVIVASGAAGAVEELIAERTSRALAALAAAPITRQAHDTLAALAVAATARRV
ncbi:MAG TPA: polyprenyl synthetase family protein [Mycobacteriales bacterium]|nr:polyprenyl synthetase family protein [Mycobacteriales bacterium]